MWSWRNIVTTSMMCIMAIVYLLLFYRCHIMCMLDAWAMLSFDMLHAQVGCMILQLFIVGTR